MKTFLITTLCFALCVPELTAIAKESSKQKNISLKPTADVVSKTLNNSWYVMQSGSSPWGYFHEAIEKRQNTYVYRYEMVKHENGKEYLENMGAIAKEDLTPIAFNLSKAGDAGTEIINGSYKEEDKSGHFTIEISGTKKTKLSRYVSKDTILEVFFPIFLSKKIPGLKPGATGSTKVFTEDASEGTSYIAKSVQYKYNSKNEDAECYSFDVTMDDLKSIWCITEQGALQKMLIGGHNVTVERVANEQEAKKFLATEVPSKKSKKQKTNDE